MKTYLKINKRAQGHVEMILSFLIFISAVIFIFTFLNPLSQPKEKISSMNEIKTTIIGNLSSDIGQLSIITNETEDCYNFVPSDYSNNNYFEIENAPRKYIIFFSEIFQENYASKKDDLCSSVYYTIGSYSEDKIIVYEKVIEMKDRYLAYDSLKKSLRIKDDFSFNFMDFDRKEIPEMSVSKDIPAGIVRDSYDLPVRVINSSANIQELILNIRVW